MLRHAWVGALENHQTTRDLSALKSMREKNGYDVNKKFWASQDVEVGDRFRRRDMSHKVYVIERFIERNDHPRHVCLVCIENSETLTVALSALLDGKLFERVEA